ncbi:hypothetical protein NE237_019218 [Protea cynaroides]|uniref:NADPH oxidase Respiratory burst domain-containing protein n=1 Tax=Protea cynaroides TaxID=273540 RepID=A0A9Q0KBG6_9MAGN|nr:hypothetical protein NE237_019218 [Protea cynaroides]
MHTIVLRSVEPTATFDIDHDTKSGYKTAPVSRSTTLRRSASNQNGAGDALAARARRREEAAMDWTKSRAHKAIRGLRFISNQKGFDGWSRIDNNFEKFAKDDFLQRSDFGQCVEGGQEQRWKNWRRRSEGDSNYAGYPDDLKSTSGYVFMMTSGAVSWKLHCSRVIIIQLQRSGYGINHLKT